MNHKYVFVNIIICNHSNENITQNMSENPKTMYPAPKHIIYVNKIISVRISYTDASKSEISVELQLLTKTLLPDIKSLKIVPFKQQKPQQFSKQ